MAILNYSNQFRYSGSGYVDVKMAPVESVDKLENDIRVLISEYIPGMKVTVLNDGEFGAMDYILNENYEWKRAINLDSLTLSFDRGNYDGDEKVENLLQLHYTNTNGELVALGEALDLSVLLEDVEGRIEALESKDDADTNTFVVEGNIVTEKNGTNGLFLEFKYNDGNVFHVDVTELSPKTYENGVGILIGEDNVIGVDEEWFNEWFDNKIAEINEKIAAYEKEITDIKTNVSSLSEMLNTISGKVESNTSEISKVNTDLATALSQIAENKKSIENTNTEISNNKTQIINLAELIAKIQGVEYIKAGENISIETNEEGKLVISAVIPEVEVDLTKVETRLTNVENTVETHTKEISSLQEAIKNMNPEGEGLSGDNETIKTNDNGALTVMISNQDNNIIKKNSDGIFAQGIEMVLGDEEINEDENN